MADTLVKSKINKAKRLDKRFLLLALSLELVVQNHLDKLSEDMQAEVNKYADEQGITDHDVLVKSLVALLAAYWLAYGSTVAKYQGDIALARVENDLKVIVPKLTKAGATKEAIKLTSELKGYPQRAVRDFIGIERGGKDYYARITTLKSGTEKTVRNIIANSLKEGKPATYIAKQIQQYVNPLPGGPRTAPYDVYRKTFGRGKDFTPKGIPAGSIQHNSLMIARTETAEMYRDATTKFYATKDYIKGFRWVLSNSHPHTDICDDLAAHGIYDKDEKRPFSHPYCLCDWVAVLKSEAEIRQLLKQEAL